ncbi:MAG: exodeoxyribonuclease VII large subunit, partial [Peptostreptococcales bacterium]
NVTDIDVKGQGNLHIAFERLKEKLQEKGYFDIEKKRPLHPFPRKIAIITAETGAAIRDMLKVIREKNRFVEIFLFPSLVQGEFAAQEIASNIDLINKEYKEIDTIIIGRGGGSLEELWAFNEEILADSIYHSAIPIISAVGHEIDYSIADFVADVRAATPTQAAEMAVPDIHLLEEKLTFSLKDIQLFIHRNLTNAENSLYKRGIDDIKAALFEKLQKADRKNEEIFDVLRQKLREMIQENSNKLAIFYNDLENLNPEVLFKRGYSITLDSNRKNVKSIIGINEGDNIFIMLTDGVIEATVKHKTKKNDGKYLDSKEEEDE